MGLASRMVKRWSVVLVAATILVAAGCSSGALHEAGTSCSTDGDCAAGLTCLGVGTASGGGCMTVAKACTKACETDLDCLAVGSGFRCLPACQGAGTCVLTRAQTD